MSLLKISDICYRFYYRIYYRIRWGKPNPDLISALPAIIAEARLMREYEGTFQSVANRKSEYGGSPVDGLY